jgi:nucleotide-binding universal stress UspA family protein
MYRRILVAIEHSAADRAILDHVEKLATLTGASLVLVHVADGWAARHFENLKLRESEEILDDRAYLESLRIQLQAKGLTVETRLLMGDPSSQLAKAVDTEGADLLAMATRSPVSAGSGEGHHRGSSASPSDDSRDTGAADLRRAILRDRRGRLPDAHGDHRHTQLARGVVDESGDTFRGGVAVERKHGLTHSAQHGRQRVVVAQDHLVIEFTVDPGLHDLLDVRKIHDHVAMIERLCLDVDLDHGVVPMRKFAVAVVVEQTMAVAKINALGNQVHV